MNRKPVVGITSDHKRDAKGRASHFLWDEYIRAVENAGGIPLLLPISEGNRRAREIAEAMNALLVTGSANDVDPALFGEERHPHLGNIDALRTEFEMGLIRAFLRKGKAVLGICYGMQTINVALGGSLIQHIPSQVDGALHHSQQGDPSRRSHTVHIVEATRLHGIIRGEHIKVNSTHHQAVARLGKGIVKSAWSEDGIIEGIEKAGYSFCIGVQWHPERLIDVDKAAARIFKAFIQQARQMD